MVERVRRLRGSGRTSRTSRYVYIFLRFQQSVLKRVEAFSAGPAQNQHKTTKPAETRRDQYKTSTKQRNWQRPAQNQTKRSESSRDQHKARETNKTATLAESQTPNNAKQNAASALASPAENLASVLSLGSASSTINKYWLLA